MLHSIWNFFCNLFISKENQRHADTNTKQNKNTYKTFDMHIQFYTNYRYLIHRKTNILQRCTKILNTKDSFKRQPLFPSYILFV